MLKAPSVLWRFVGYLSKKNKAHRISTPLSLPTPEEHILLLLQKS